MKCLLDDFAYGRSAGELSYCFHLWLVRTARAMVDCLYRQDGTVAGTKKLFLGGGCFQNTMLLEFLGKRLEADGLQVYTGEQVPVNDGGLALGQLYIASQRLQESKVKSKIREEK